MKINFIYLFIILSTSLFAQNDSTNILIIKIIGFKSNDGFALVNIYNKESGFPTEPDSAFKKLKTEIVNREAIVVVEGLAEGKYAIAITHDENGNLEMDTNWIGMPSEGYGASNDAKGSFGPPSFEDAAIIFNGGKKSIQINLKY